VEIYGINETLLAAVLEDVRGRRDPVKTFRMARWVRYV
jgi:hypothetical protein